MVLWLGEGDAYALLLSLIHIWLTLLRHCRGGVYPRPQSAEPRTPPGSKGRAATRAAPAGRLTLLRHCRGGIPAR